MTLLIDKTHLGDGVYAAIQGEHVILFTESFGKNTDGEAEYGESKIYLEKAVLENLLQYIARAYGVQIKIY